MGIPQGWELVLLLGVLVLLFGATKLPNAARSIGQSMRIFKAETKGLRSDDATPSAATPPPASAESRPPTPPVQERTEALPPAAPPQSAPVDQTQGHHDTTR